MSRLPDGSTSSGPFLFAFLERQALMVLEGEYDTSQDVFVTVHQGERRPFVLTHRGMAATLSVTEKRREPRDPDQSSDDLY
jgi:hypothetical protein